jgi:uncharacterized protein YeaO (DUF488 family)
MKSIKIYTSFVSPITLKEFCDNNILPIIIVRNIKNSELIGKFNGTAIHFRDLSPSSELFRSKRDGLISQEEFAKEYAIEISQINIPEILDKIEYLANLSNTDKVVLLGYGTDDSRCHRSVLREILNKTGLLEHKVTEAVI